MRKLDRLTQNEARVTTAQTLEVVHRLVEDMKVVMDGAETYSSFHPLIVENLSL
jgi:hypothetical protein